MKDFKIRVNEAQSKIVQETCFKNNVNWFSGNSFVIGKNEPFLYIERGSITWDSSINRFMSCSIPELTFDEFQLEYNGILPEKWCIRLTEDNLELVGGYYDRDFINPIYNKKEKIGTYLTSHNLVSGVSITEKEHKSNFITIGKPKEWIEISTDQFKKYVLGETSTLPKYFAIKKVDSPLWQKYIDWLNRNCEGGDGWEGEINAFYGYDGTEGYGGTDYHTEISSFENNPIEITLEQWEKCIMKEKFAAAGKAAKITVEAYHAAFDKEETINTNNMKYKLVKKEYIDAVMGILYNKPSWLANTDEIIIEDPVNIQRLSNAGVLHWFKEINEYQIGDLCCVIDSSHFSYLETGKLYRINEVGNDGTCHFDNGSGKLRNACWLRLSYFRKATPAEIKEYELLEKANRDYPVGTRYFTVNDSGDKTPAKVQGAFKYYKHNDNLTDGYGGAVYYKGKWAEIIPNEPDITIAGEKVEFYDHYIKIGCTEIRITSIKLLLDLPITQIYLTGGYIIDRSDIVEIFAYYNNK